MQWVMKYNINIVLIFFFFFGVDRVPEWFKNCKTLKGTNNITDKRARGLLGKC